MVSRDSSSLAASPAREKVLSDCFVLLLQDVMRGSPHRGPESIGCVCSQEALAADAGLDRTYISGI